MIIDKLNLNHLRLFECVYRTHSMTQAAEELHLTQSGVSQHIQSLEEALELKLFDRIRQRLIPTKAAQILYEKCNSGLHSIEEALLAIKGIQKELVGTVSIGMPIEFGNNVVMPLITKFCQKHPQLRLDIKYGYADEMNSLILEGQLDFALVDAFGFDQRIYTEVVSNELLILCASKDYLKKRAPFKEDKKFFQSLGYIDYVKGEPVIRMWLKHHFNLKHPDLIIRATVTSVQGVAKLIFAGVGAGILPSHHIAKLGKLTQQLHSFKGSGKPIKNSISIAYLRERTHSPTTRAVLQWLESEVQAVGFPSVHT